MRRVLVLCAVASLALAAVALAAAGTATKAGWTLQVTYRDATLDDISCSSTTSCAAVGFRAPSPQAGLGKAIVAVLSGGHWTMRSPGVPAGAIDSALNGVACREQHCWAVGAYTFIRRGELAIRSLADRSTGAGPWVLRAHPAPDVGPNFESSVLVSISCATVTFCATVGHTGALDFAYYPVALIYHGQTGRWIHVPLFPGQVFMHRTLRFGGVSCAVANACMAVGTYNPPGPPANYAFSARYREHWRIVKMLVAPGSDDVTVGGVSCVAATDCWAVGQYGQHGPTFPFLRLARPFAIHYTGSWHKIVSLPIPAGTGTTGAVLTDVKCPQRGSCIAVGAATHYGVPIRPLVYHLSHGRWRIQAAPSPFPPQHPYLNALSCPTPNMCVAIGLYSTVSGSFVERYAL